MLVSMETGVVKACVSMEQALEAPTSSWPEKSFPTLDWGIEDVSTGEKNITHKKKLPQTYETSKCCIKV